MIVTQPSKISKPTSSENSSCVACRFLGVDDHRVYFDNEDFIIIENFNAMAPILVAKKHGHSKIPFKAFQELKKVCSKLFSDAYCFCPSTRNEEHYFIKVIKLNSIALPVY